MGETTHNTRHKEEHDKAYRTKTARERRPESQQPDTIENQMRPVCMQKHVRHKSGQVDKQSTWQRQIFTRWQRGKTRRAQGEIRNQSVLLRWVEKQADDMHPYQHTNQADDNGRRVKRRWFLHTSSVLVKFSHGSVLPLQAANDHCQNTYHLRLQTSWATRSHPGQSPLPCSGANGLSHRRP